MENEVPQKMSKHVCSCGNSKLSMISEDPVLDIFKVLADKNVLTMIRGMIGTEVRSPFPDGLFGLDYDTTNKTLKTLCQSGLVNTKRDGPDHVYFLHKTRFKVVSDFLNEIQV